MTSTRCNCYNCIVGGNSCYSTLIGGGQLQTTSCYIGHRPGHSVLKAEIICISVGIDIWLNDSRYKNTISLILNLGDWGNKIL